MKVLVTGGAGFLGQQMIAALLDRAALTLDGRAHRIERVVCFDQAGGALRDPRVSNVTGDFADRATLERLVDRDTAIVIHLAAVVSGTAEADFDLGMRVNLDGTRGLLECCRVAGHRPRVLFSSSIAVFGPELPPVVDDATAPMPQGSYGVQKLIGELLVHDFTRKGFVDGRSVRLPTVVVRPGQPNGAASGFASGIIREPLSGVEAVLPVDPSTAMWIASPRAVVRMMLHALELPSSAWGAHRSLNLPGLTVSIHEALATLREIGGAAAAALVRRVPDERIARLVTSWPARFDTARAHALDFRADADFAAIVRAYVEDNPDAVRLPR